MKTGLLVLLILVLCFAAHAQSKLTKKEAETAWKLMVSDVSSTPAVAVKKGLLEKIGNLLGIGESSNAWDYGPTRKTVIKKDGKVIRTVYKREKIIREEVKEEVVVAKNEITGERVTRFNKKVRTYKQVE